MMTGKLCLIYIGCPNNRSDLIVGDMNYDTRMALSHTYRCIGYRVCSEVERMGSSLQLVFHPGNFDD